MQSLVCLVAALMLISASKTDAALNAPTSIGKYDPPINVGTACLLMSPNGIYGLYFDGHVKVFAHDTSGNKIQPPVWMDSQTSAATNFDIQLDSNTCIGSNFCYFTQDSNCPGNKGAASIQLTNAGQIVIYNSDNNIIWISVSPVSGTTQNKFSTTCCFSTQNKGCSFLGNNY